MRRVFILVLTCIILSATITATQKRRRKTVKPKPSASKAAAAKSAAEMKAGREQVATQIKTLTRFLYLLGGIAKGIESVDEAVRSNEASPTAVEQNERNKTKVREGIRSVREGLDKIEKDFLFSPALEVYYSNVAGVAKLGAAAESQAVTGQFDAVGRSLLDAVGRLADALAAMRDR